MDTITLRSQHESPARTRTNVKNTTTRVTPNFPVELHKLIVDELEGDKKALEQCALTCKLYRNLAQKLLFKSVLVGFSTFAWDKSETADKFLDILRASPQIADYVQRLQIYQYRESRMDMIQSDKSLSTIVRALPNVVDLVLGEDEMFYEFPRMSPEMQSAIMDKCQSLLSLTVRFMYGIPLKIFNHLQRLETLTLDNTTFADDPSVQIAQTPSKIKHMTLDVVCTQSPETQSFFPFLVEQGIGMGNLESLTVDMTQRSAGSRPLFPPRDVQAIRNLIRSSAGSLKVLQVTTSWQAPVILPDNEPVFDLSELPLLEEWSLCGAAYNRDRVSLGWVSTHLQTAIPANRRYKRAELRLVIADHVKLVEGDQMDPEGFKYFEKVIVDKILPQTGSFSIDFLIWEDDQGPIPKQIQKYLPTLHALHLLHFS
ncbi:hypothetical protein D9613_008744 [Agrocybe pediades]|uniref:Uncharacterized protein n=1 Tax=Agrocybe pediades TaxID=84607 RepID=A0A8H4VQS0_9AGAR|nr:hypothetical protein D9613_008744 [Agrocybe pediades]